VDGLAQKDIQVLQDGADLLASYYWCLSNRKIVAEAAPRARHILHLLPEYQAPVRSHPTRGQIIATVIALKLMALNDPLRATNALARASDWATKYSPTLGQNCLISSIELYRFVGLKDTATSLLEKGRLTFDPPNNPTPEVTFWE